MIFAIMLKKSLLFYLLITSLPDTTGGEGNPPLRRHLAIFPEDTHRCFAAGYDVVYSRASAYLSSQKKGAPKDTFLTIFPRSYIRRGIFRTASPKNRSLLWRK
jgi:hypothetical protein